MNQDLLDYEHFIVTHGEGCIDAPMVLPAGGMVSSFHQIFRRGKQQTILRDDPTRQAWEFAQFMRRWQELTLTVPIAS